MLKLFRFFGKKFFFFSNKHEPIHEQIENVDGNAKFIISDDIKLDKISELDSISKNIEPLTKTQRRLIGNILTYHGKNKELAAQRIAQYLKRPLQVEKILQNLNS